ncbi:MAG: sulfatase-like hydrolase/transferase [Acidobacteriota bacterium]
MSGTTATTAAGAAPGPPSIRTAAHLGALSALGVAQPLLEEAATTPEYFVVRGGGAWDFLALACLGPPLAAIALTALAGRVAGGAPRRRLETLLLGVFAAAIAALVLKQAAALPGIIAVPLALLLGGAFSAAYRRRRGLRLFLDALAVLALAVPALFVAAPSMRPLLFSGTFEPPTPPHLERPAPVVLVIFDELPTDSLLGPGGGIDGARFPGFARLASTATWYRRAHTPAYGTLSSIPVILSGVEAQEPLLPTVYDYPRNLFTLLRDSHLTVAEEPLTQLRPDPEQGPASAGDARGLGSLPAEMGLLYLHRVAPADWSRYLPNVTTSWDAFRRRARGDAGSKGHGGGDRGGTFRAFVESIRAGDRPPLAVIHSLLPHHPWHYLPSGRRYDTGDELYIDGLRQEELGTRDGRWRSDPQAVLRAYRRHLLQVGFADRLLGELLDRLESEGLFDDALVVVTADHGIHFEPGAPVRQAGPRTWRGVARVPLLVKYPRQGAAEVDDAIRRTTDIVPTVFDALGASGDWPMDGSSLRRPPPAGRGEPEHLTPATGIAEVWHAATGGDPAMLGPAAAALVGRPLPEILGAGSPSGFRAILDRHARVLDLASRGPEADLLPVRITGRLAPAGPGAPVPNQVDLALAVDGVVAATARAQGTPGGPTTFAFLMPESFAAGGFTELELAALRPSTIDPGVPTLEPVTLEAPTRYRLLDGRLIGPEGPLAEVSGGQGEAVALSFEGLGHRIEIFGWATDPDGRPAVKVLAFDGERFAGSADVDLETSPFAMRYLLGARSTAGFRMFVAATADGGTQDPAAGTPADGLRLFALFDDGTTAEVRHQRRHLPAADANGPFSL